MACRGRPGRGGGRDRGRGRYPWIPKQLNETAVDTLVTYRNTHDNQLVAPPEELDFNRAGVPEHAAWLLRVRSCYRRAALASIFYNQAKRLGIDVTFGVHIVDYEEDEAQGTGSAIAEDGARYTADIVVAADGLGSKSYNLILGEPLRASLTGFVACRVMYQVEDLVDPFTQTRGGRTGAQ
ncbi:hypothetical protein INS49_007582 [Diaporthe citri]|uniref:uncharacterized protein n=1 Tax=Diaporthe citri TaxID=83186 RepID=UPI001C80B2DE|nr:uncharacterized protein INS49_007582 [Diaporthe citri]KAG6353283.1 hypothetical protein INS49_007582 [Diaporthe citri]